MRLCGLLFTSLLHSAFFCTSAKEIPSLLITSFYTWSPSYPRSHISNERKKERERFLSPVEFLHRKKITRAELVKAPSFVMCLVIFIMIIFFVTRLAYVLGSFGALKTVHVDDLGIKATYRNINFMWTPAKGYELAFVFSLCFAFCYLIFLFFLC